MEKDKPTKQQRKARRRLEKLNEAYPTLMDNPPNRKWRRDLEQLLRAAGYDDVIEGQQKIWDKNRKDAKQEPTNEEPKGMVCSNCGTFHKGHLEKDFVCPECGVIVN